MGETQIKRRSGTSVKLKEPPEMKVYILNDDVTPMEFVTSILEKVFEKPEKEATVIMTTAHLLGKALVGKYNKNIAEKKVKISETMAGLFGYPLKFQLEEA